MSSELGYPAALALHARRLAEGWRPVGRKIGFTNRTIWPRYGVYEPIWGMVYDRTLVAASGGKASIPLAGLSEPRIEPEIAFKLRAAPASADPAHLLSCLDWVAHSVEIVQCAPSWKTVTLARSQAQNGLHGGLVLGPPIAMTGALAEALPRVEVVLKKNGVPVERGVGENVLGSPLAALAHLVQVLARQPDAPALAAGEIVTTGTLTDAHPVAIGEVWTTELAGLPLPGLEVRFL